MAATVRPTGWCWQCDGDATHIGDFAKVVGVGIADSSIWLSAIGTKFGSFTLHGVRAWHDEDYLRLSGRADPVHGLVLEPRTQKILLMPPALRYTGSPQQTRSMKWPTSS